ncbi:MAG: hypothetical protein A3A58_02405 [Candidatus Blackburnbacteria bacterium RIFCSPLOWO2_01_FULL_41_27]|uniref:RCK N-terminal domain-containing protein n=2 Tax=Candidatus Blackburniibacteriota TaxID=1817898 RepID=A0A1G1V6E7_9BACT|nr:MAG: hypothetical protein A3F61_02680 [Candidatus Blackburnbacteria bacterium RIFCSPHIGHO2_12_FULL_41_13b]OGY13329.1 MAG: hypothetical protein A3A58_02405 [Candidatus Blackburnbacteria bacterium RIFCSPLOWO2_01_FULL_41_27]
MSIFLAVSVGIIAAAFFGFVARLFRQPPIVGYLFAGLALALLGVFSDDQKPLLQTMAQLGVTFLLFLIGLEINLRELASIGRVVILGGIGQIFFTSLAGYFIASLLGFSAIESLYIAVALTFSSTIVVVKLLSEKKDLDSLYGKITVGFLLVQDIAAILTLVFLSGFQTTSFEPLTFFWVLVKGVGLLAVVYLLSKFVLTRVFDRVATTSVELLFVSSIGWMLGVASIVSLPQIGFTPEIGGLLAGVALANSSAHLQIASRVKPLRDFFITIFFLLLGTKMVVGLNPQVIIPALILSVFVVVGGPLIVLGLLGLLGHKKRTSFLSAVTFAQVSEFSLILIAFGRNLGHVSEFVVGLVTLVAVITMITSTYLIINGYRLYLILAPILGIFERKKICETALSINREFAEHVVLLGCDRLGRRVLPLLEKKEKNVVVIDFNPRVVSELVAQNHQAYYGDASDVETLESLGLGQARLIVSTTGSLEDNLIVLEYLGKLEKPPLSIFAAATPQEALTLYEKGADYVIVPLVAAGDHLAHLLSVHGINKNHFKVLRERHFDRLAKDRF